MEVLSDLQLNFDSELNCLEDLYPTMDSCLAEGDELSRPASTLSMASWTFSPISGDESSIRLCEESEVPDHELIKIEPRYSESSQVETVSETQGQTVVSDEVSQPVVLADSEQQHQQQQQEPVDELYHQQQEQLQHHMQFLRQQQQLIQQKHQLQQQQQQQRRPSQIEPAVVSQSSSPVVAAVPAVAAESPVTDIHSEYYKSNNVSYHQFVNVHNYGGNYSIGVPIWRDAYPWHNPSAIQSRVQTPVPPYMDHGEMLASLSANTVSEIKRCSTPDYLLTLKTLSQLDSPPRATNTPSSNSSSCWYGENSVSQDGSVQDSGYNSDLNVSPLIEYQDSRVMRYPRLCDRKQTSTPSAMNQQNVRSEYNEVRNKAVSNLSYLGQTTNNVPVAESRQHLPVNDTYTHSVQKNLMGDLKMYTQQGSPQFSSMADFHATKKEVKGKPSVISDKVSGKRKRDNGEDKENCSNKRRHNQPLNDSATRVMTDWYETHLGNPYPSKVEKEKLAKDGGITVAQVKSWFANKRNRSNNTRPKKQMKEMEGKLMEICHELARDAYKPVKDNAYYIQQLSGILGQGKY